MLKRKGYLLGSVRTFHGRTIRSSNEARRSMKDARKINIGEGPKEQGGKIFFFLKKNPGAETRRLLKEAPLVEKKKKKKKKTRILTITGSVTLHVALTADRLVITDHPPRHAVHSFAQKTAEYF